MYGDRETQGASSQQEKKVGDSYTELSMDCAALSWQVRKEINWWDLHHEAARKLTMLFPDLSTTHQCQFISRNILRETGGLPNIKMKISGKISINTRFWYNPHKKKKKVMCF